MSMSECHEQSAAYKEAHPQYCCISFLGPAWAPSTRKVTGPIPPETTRICN